MSTRNSKNTQCIRFKNVCEKLVEDKKAKSTLEIALELKYHSQHLYQILLFNAKPTISLLERLHKKYNVNMNYIFGKSEEMFLKPIK
jgi:hypothetical protein